MIRDETADGRIVLEQDGATAELVYEVEGDQLLLIHTEVPDALGGQGIGGQLVRAAVDKARTDGLTIVPWCPFARRWLREHADEAEGVAIDWKRPPG